MAWLKLTKVDGNMLLVNIDQVSEIRRVKDSSGDDFGAALWSYGEATGVHETVGEIAAMIADAERRERLDGIFKAIVYNFPHGYDPGEIVETARRLLDALDKPREV